MSEEEKYTTSDLYLGAYLKLKGYKMTVEKNRNKAVFVFEKHEGLQKEVNNYLNESGSCEPLLFTNSIKNLKNLLYNL
jgi:tRNA pseudouridine-54 N-methylase